MHDFTERLAYALYESAITAGLERRHEWHAIRDEYLKFAANFLNRLTFTPGDIARAQRFELPIHSQEHPHPHSG